MRGSPEHLRAGFTVFPLRAGNVVYGYNPWRPAPRSREAFPFLRLWARGRGANHRHPMAFHCAGSPGGQND